MYVHAVFRTWCHLKRGAARVDFGSRPNDAVIAVKCARGAKFLSVTIERRARNENSEPIRQAEEEESRKTKPKHLSHQVLNGTLNFFRSYF